MPDETDVEDVADVADVDVDRVVLSDEGGDGGCLGAWIFSSRRVCSRVG